MNLSIGGIKIRVEVLLLIALICSVLFFQTAYACSCCGTKEGFYGGDMNTEDYQKYELGHDKPVDASKWGMPDLSVKKGQEPGPGVTSILNRKPQQVPLPEGQLSMFANTPFKPECCPNAYSNGSGCACMTVNQYNYLVSRGGNNVPFSEY